MRQCNRRNGLIDLLRFLASIIIVLTHFGISGSLKFFGGAIFVEFFFLLSGYYGMVFLHDEPFVIPQGSTLEQEIGTYCKKKYFKMFPYVLEGVCLYYVSYWLEYGSSVKDIIKTSAFIPLETALLGLTGASQVHAGVYWYLSGLFIVLPIFMWLSVKVASIFFNYLVVFVPWIMHGYLFYKYGTLRIPTSGFDIFFRVSGDFLFSGLLYLIVRVLKRQRFSRRGKWIMTITAVGSFGAALSLTMRQSLTKSRYEEIFVVLVMLSLALTLSEQLLICNLDIPLFTILAKLSLPIYIFHWPIFTILKTLIFQEGYTNDFRIAIGLVVTFLVSGLFIVFNEKIGTTLMTRVKELFLS